MQFNSDGLSHYLTLLFNGHRANYDSNHDTNDDTNDDDDEVDIEEFNEIDSTFNGEQQRHRRDQTSNNRHHQETSHEQSSTESDSDIDQHIEKRFTLIIFNDATVSERTKEIQQQKVQKTVNIV